MQERVPFSVAALREKERKLRALPSSSADEQLRFELLAILCRFMAFAGDSTTAVQWADEALAHLDEGEKAMRSRAHSAKAVAYWIEGKAQESTEAYDQCMTLALSSSNYSLAAPELLSP